MSQSPIENQSTHDSQSPELSPSETVSIDAAATYLDAWVRLAEQIQQGRSFSGRERNCCFLNTKTGQFADISSAVGLDQIDDSRAIATVDWDHDGDLDLWTSNRTGPRVRFLRNDVPQSGTYIAIRLAGSPELGCSRDAIGSRVILTVADADGQQQQRSQTLFAGDSFLSQSSKWLHFAIGTDETVVAVTVRWPGTIEPESFARIEVGRRQLLRQGMGKAEIIPGTREVVLATSTPQPPEISDKARVRLSEPPMLEEIEYQGWNGELVQLSPPFDGPLLVMLWASWCQPCLAELHEVTETMSVLGDAAPRLLALNVESLGDATPPIAEIKSVLANVGFQGDSGFASSRLVDRFNELNQHAVYRLRSLPLPTSVLVDHGGWVRTIYKGPIEVADLTFDMQHLRTTEDEGRKLAVPFPGRWSNDEFVTNPIAVATVQIEQGYLDEARDYLAKYLTDNPPPPADQHDEDADKSRLRLADVHYQMATIEKAAGNLRAALRRLQDTLSIRPSHLPALLESATVYRSAGKLDEAYDALLQAQKLYPENADLHNKLGVIRLQQSRSEDAIRHFRDALQVDADFLPAANNLSWLLATHLNAELRDGELAVWLAEKVCAASDYQQPQALDTYAAALAENGQYEKAAQVAKNAIEIAKKAPSTLSLEQLIDKLEQRKSLYEAGKPYHQ